MECAVKRYKLNGASQEGYIGWKWFDAGNEKVVIPHGDILRDVHDFCYESTFSGIKKIIMNLSGARYYYSEKNQRTVVLYSSIIDRYFDGIEPIVFCW